MFGTLAALDLQDGHVTARVEILTAVSNSLASSPTSTPGTLHECTIRIILDNHSAHISKETQAFLSKHTQTVSSTSSPRNMAHGSISSRRCSAKWKLSAYIPVQSLDELKTRILKGIAEINAAPVVHRWKNFKALAQD